MLNFVQEKKRKANRQKQTIYFENVKNILENILCSKIFVIFFFNVFDNLYKGIKGPGQVCSASEIFCVNLYKDINTI